MSEQLWFSGNVARDVQDELDREPADVLLVDAMLIGGLCAGEASGVPTVASFHAACSLFRGSARQDACTRAARGCRHPSGARLAAGRCDLGRPRSLHAEPRRAAREFEPDMPFPPNVTFVGPVLDGPALLPDSDEVDVDDGQLPLVLVSFSTSDQAQVPVLQRCIDALAAVPANDRRHNWPRVRSRRTRRRGEHSHCAVRSARRGVAACVTGGHARRPGHRDVGAQSRRAAAVPAARPRSVLQRRDGRTARCRPRASGRER